MNFNFSSYEARLARDLLVVSSRISSAIASGGDSASDHSGTLLLRSPFRGVPEVTIAEGWRRSVQASALRGEILNLAARVQHEQLKGLENVATSKDIFAAAPDLANPPAVPIDEILHQAQHSAERELAATVDAFNEQESLKESGELQKGSFGDELVVVQLGAACELVDIEFDLPQIADLDGQSLSDAINGAIAAALGPRHATGVLADFSGSIASILMVEEHSDKNGGM